MLEKMDTKHLQMNLDNLLNMDRLMFQMTEGKMPCRIPLLGTDMCIPLDNPLTVAALWKKYLQYLRDWADTHSEPGFYGMTPACFDEWLDCEYMEADDDAI